MKKYTVVLLRPEYLNKKTETPYGQDVYVAIGVRSSEPMFAVRLARSEVFQADKKEGLKPESASDYKLCVLFEGEHKPKLFGWQVP